MPKIGDYTINLAGTLPSEQRCGLATIYGELVKHPEAIRFAVIAFDVQHIKLPTDPGEPAEPTLRIKRWEVADGATVEQAMLELIDAINGRREGSDAEQATLATVAEGGGGEQGELGGADQGDDGEGGPLGGWPAAADDATLRGEE